MIDITNASSVSSIGIAQSGLIVESGVSYHIGFIAKAEQDREMVVLLQANINNQSWPTYLNDSKTEECVSRLLVKSTERKPDKWGSFRP